MSITVSSILSLVFFGNLIILIIYIISRIPSVFNRMNCQFMIWLLCLTFIRFLFPCETKYSISLPISNIVGILLRFIRLHTFTIMNYTFYVYQLLLAIWFSISFILLCKLVAKYILFQIHIKKLIREPQTILLEKPQELSFPKPLTIYKSDYVTSPMITGIRKPTIILPSLSFSQQELSLILDHELQHYKYSDLLLKICIEIFCILYWWNPAMRLLKKQILLLLEMRADTETCEKLTDTEKINYLECLKKICAHQSKEEQKNTIFESRFARAEKKASILKRAEYLLHEKDTRFPVGTAVIFSLLLLCSLVLVIEPVPSGTFGLPEDSYIVKTPENTYKIYFGDEFISYIEDPYPDDPYDNSVGQLPIYENSREGKVIRKNEKEIPIYVFTTPMLFILLLCACISPELRKHRKQN